MDSFLNVLDGSPALEHLTLDQAGFSFSENPLHRKINLSHLLSLYIAYDAGLYIPYILSNIVLSPFTHASIESFGWNSDSRGLLHCLPPDKTDLKMIDSVKHASLTREGGKYILLGRSSKSHTSKQKYLIDIKADAGYLRQAADFGTALVDLGLIFQDSPSLTGVSIRTPLEHLRKVDIEDWVAVFSRLRLLTSVEFRQMLNTGDDDHTDFEYTFCIRRFVEALKRTELVPQLEMLRLTYLHPVMLETLKLDLAKLLALRKTVCSAFGIRIGGQDWSP
ncbi:hypothetical protein EIP91_007186 [Steccherinum ochraceum]|uniref:Uncharacterized protein n=1 Tax=Steccherinum ochraceum TaxID=92696 RepID=A0A4R0RQV1_9APHY|nr:hypothetical protein EIP91_007186 [Steccherinum ochraceum]